MNKHNLIIILALAALLAYGFSSTGCGTTQHTGCPKTRGMVGY